MKFQEFKNNLRYRKIDENKINDFVSRLENYEEYLKIKNETIEAANYEILIEYSEQLIDPEKDSVLNFLIALMNYANFIKKNEIIEQIIDISESYNAMDTLYSRLEEFHGEKVRNKVFNNFIIPPLGLHPEKKPEFTKEVFKRLENVLEREEIVKIISPCLHGRPPEDIEADKRDLKELGLDNFLLKKRQELIERLETHKANNTLEFAQIVDEEVINFVKTKASMGPGTRKGNIIYQSKIPYQLKKFLNEHNDNLKRYYTCYCPWIRAAIRDGNEKDLPNYFCHCSAGWYKLYWEQLFEQSVMVEPIETALNGALECKFAIYIPESIVENYVKK